MDWLSLIKIIKLQLLFELFVLLCSILCVYLYVVCIMYSCIFCTITHHTTITISSQKAEELVNWGLEIQVKTFSL